MLDIENMNSDELIAHYKKSLTEIERMQLENATILSELRERGLMIYNPSKPTIR